MPPKAIQDIRNRYQQQINEAHVKAENALRELAKLEMMARGYNAEHASAVAGDTANVTMMDFWENLDNSEENNA